MLQPARLERLVRRYTKPGPRYTSYPTAPHFTSDFDGLDYQHALVHSNLESRELSLYVHLPFCPELCFYCGCTTTITKKRARITAYLRTLEREVSRVAILLGPDRTVRQIHWGGGTPTYLMPEEIVGLMDHIRGHFHVAANAEAGIEADPRGLTPDHLAAARSVGFNRISFGVQDLDERVQRAIGRVQPYEMVEQAVQESRRLGFTNVNLDLIYGLPYQTGATYERTLGQVLALAPDRLSVFSYAHVPWMKRHQRAIPAAALPDPVAKLQMFVAIAERLGEAGYRHIGLDHFARPEDPLCRAQDRGTLYRNFQGYSTHAGLDLLAFGASGIGQLGRVYAQNHKEQRSYTAAVEAGELPIARGRLLTDEDLLRREIITRLMCDFKLDYRPFAPWGVEDFERRFAASLEALRPLEADGLVRRLPGGLRVTPAGRLFIRNVAAAFDAYLVPEAQAPTQRYSLTV